MYALLMFCSCVCTLLIIFSCNMHFVDDSVAILCTLLMILVLFLPAYSGILCEFLEVAIHLILYIREVYPPGKTQAFLSV